MGMSLAIDEVHCAAQCAVANISIASAALLLKCPNCRGGNSANDKIFPRYKRETEILEITEILKLKTKAMLMPVKHIELPEVLQFRIWFHNPLFPLFRNRQ